MPLGTLRRLECVSNGFFDVRFGVRATEPAPVVIERGPGKVRDLQQER